MSAFTSVDFPTFGRPTIATVPRRVVAVTGARGLAGVVCFVPPTFVPRACELPSFGRDFFVAIAGLVDRRAEERKDPLRNRARLRATAAEIAWSRARAAPARAAR